MHKQPHLLPSGAMGRKIYLWQYGHFGPPLLVFPSASGMAHEWESHGMIDALAPLINAGRLKVYCVESNVSEAWTRRETDPGWRIQRHLAYERFVTDELVPAIRSDCRSPNIPIALSGCSLGAFYSATFALKYPEVFRYALCLSGRYDVSEFADGHDGLDYYYNNPMAFAPQLNGDDLDRIRRHTHISIVCGQGQWEDGNWQEAQRFASVLDAKDIPHYLDLWGTDVAHEWVWWRRQAAMHLKQRFVT